MKDNEFISALNALLADHLIIVMKLHNYHWNVRGSNFRSLHQLTEQYYEYFFGSYDSLAERILQLGSAPLVTVQKSLAAARLREDEGTTFSESDVLNGIRADFDLLRADTLATVTMAGKAGDSITEGFLLSFVAWLEKELWMLRLTLDNGGARPFPENVAA